MITAKSPYEFLARFENGTLKGAHVQWIYTTTDNGAVVASSVSPAQPVSVGSTEGFPLSDLLGETTTAAILEMERAVADEVNSAAQCKQAQAELSEANSRIAGLEASLAAALAASATPVE